MDLKENHKLNYVCINCGANVKELHKKYSMSVLKIMNCEKCKETADKYIEFEPIIILIDLVLLSQPAYRHVLYNTQFKIFSKILVVQLLFESYRMWRDIPQIANNGEYEAEREFYLSFALTVTDHILLLIMLGLLAKMANQKLTSEKSYIIHLVKAMTLANIAKFFMIPVVIWSNDTTEVASLRLLLVNGYYFLSLVNVFAVVINCSRKRSAVMTLVTIVIKHIAMIELTQRLNNFLI